MQRNVLSDKWSTLVCIEISMFIFTAFLNPVSLQLWPAFLSHIIATMTKIVCIDQFNWSVFPARKYYTRYLCYFSIKCILCVCSSVRETTHYQIATLIYIVYPSQLLLEGYSHIQVSGNKQLYWFTCHMCSDHGCGYWQRMAKALYCAPNMVRVWYG